MKVVHVTVKLYIADDADAFEVAANCDYNFQHEDIVDTEIIGVQDESAEP
jgi:hypothetical protein